AVLAVGDIGEVAAVFLGDLGDRAQLRCGQLSARDPDPHHEVGVLDVGVLERARLSARDPGTPLRVQAPPAESSAQVGGVDGVEAGVGVPIDDAIPDVEPGVVLLKAFGGIQRLEVAKGPLALAALRARHCGKFLLLEASDSGASAASGPRRAGEIKGPDVDGRPDRSAGSERDQQKERQMALDTRSRSTWRLETSIRSWHSAGRVIAGLRDLGAGTVPELALNIAGSRSHTRARPEFATP